MIKIFQQIILNIDSLILFKLIFQLTLKQQNQYNKKHIYSEYLFNACKFNCKNILKYLLTLKNTYQFDFNFWVPILVKDPIFANNADILECLLRHININSYNDNQKRQILSGLVNYTTIDQIDCVKLFLDQVQNYKFIHNEYITECIIYNKYKIFKFIKQYDPNFELHNEPKFIYTALTFKRLNILNHILTPTTLELLYTITDLNLRNQLLEFLPNLKTNNYIKDKIKLIYM